MQSVWLYFLNKYEGLEMVLAKKAQRVVILLIGSLSFLTGYAVAENASRPVLSTSPTAEVIDCETPIALHERLVEIGMPTTARIVEQRWINELQLCESVIKIEEAPVVVYSHGKWVITGEILDTSSKTRMKLSDEALKRHRKFKSTELEALQKVTGLTFGTGPKTVQLIGDPEDVLSNELLTVLLDHQTEYTIHYLFHPLSAHLFGQAVTYELICGEYSVPSLKNIQSIEQYQEYLDVELTNFEGMEKYADTDLCETLVKEFSEVNSIITAKGIEVAVPLAIFEDGSFVFGNNFSDWP
jgi:hypothetical protein